MIYLCDIQNEISPEYFTRVDTHGLWRVPWLSPSRKRNTLTIAQYLTGSFLSALCAQVCSISGGLISWDKENVYVNNILVWISFINYFSSSIFFWVYLFIYLLCLSRDKMAYGGSQARGPIRATAANLCQSHSNTRSEWHLWPMPQFTAMLDP